MRKKLRRELYMLPRGEQRALIVLSFVLVFSLAIRIGVQFLPGKEPSGLEEFEREYRALMLALSQADSIANAASGSNYVTRHPSPVTGRSPVTRHPSPVTGRSPVTRHPSPVTGRSPVTRHPSPVTGRSPVTRHPSPVTGRSPININRADSAQLLPLPGIGPVFAGRILKYRDLLGGFVNVEQLGEVYGLKIETLDLIRDHLIIDTVHIRKICIDSASFRELLRHPYLDLEDVKALVDYREFKKHITSLGELRENMILEDSSIERLAPYFDFGK